jgi:hypothetical protein
VQSAVQRGQRLKALHLYSGRPGKASSFSAELRAFGIDVEDVDWKSGDADHDLLSDVSWARFRDRLQSRCYVALLVGPPCETASPARMSQPGPPLLRSHTEFLGLRDLPQHLREQVRKANILWDRALEATGIMYTLTLPWVLESPQPRCDCASIFQFPKAVQLAGLEGVLDADFDQCMAGAMSVKPTRLRYFLADLAHLHGLRCKHPLQQFSDVDTNLGPVTYSARHQRTVRRKVEGAWATSALADYPLELNKILAAAFAGAIGRLSSAVGARLGQDR